MIPVGRCVRRRRADRHRVQRRRRARQEIARPAAVGRSGAQHHLRLFPQGRRRGLQARALRFPDQQQGAGLRRHGLQGRQGQRARSRRSSGLRTWPWGRMARSTSPTGSIRASAVTTTRTTPPRGLSTASRRRASSRASEVRCRDARRPDHGAAQPRGQRARARLQRPCRARRRGHSGGARRCSTTRIHSSARAPCGCSRVSGPRASRASRALLASADPHDCASPAYRALRQAGRALRHAPRAGARSFAGGAARSGAVAARCAVRRSREVLLTLAAGLRRQGPQLPRSLGHRRHATRKRRCTPRSRAARPARRGEVAACVLGSGLAPHAARGGARLRGARAGGRAAGGRTHQGHHGAGFHPDAGRGERAARHRAEGRHAICAQNPALWWLLNYKDSRWADAGIDAELKRRGLFDPDAVTVNEVTVPAPRGDSSLPRSPTSRSCAATRSAARRPPPPA